MRKKIGGIWLKSEEGKDDRLFIKLGNNKFYNAYINKEKKEGDKRPDWDIVFGKED
jgi:hypothetical protein